jgi:hypothetical protein
MTPNALGTDNALVTRLHADIDSLSQPPIWERT